jgi:hypothetical protein
MKTYLLVAMLGICGLFGPATAADVFTRTVVGETLAIELVPMPDKFQDRTDQVLDLFQASPDSSLWCGPTRPNPHSWLGPSIICRDTTSFDLDFCSIEGEIRETLVFENVAPAFYRFDLAEGLRPESGIYLYRFRQAGVVFHEAKTHIVQPE